MNAVISGQAGVAVLVDGLKLASIHAGSDGEAVARRPAEIRFLLGDAKDLEFLEDVDPKEASRRLEIAASKYDALHLALILLDETLSSEARRSAAEELEGLLTYPEVGDFPERVLYAHPLPHGADAVGADACCTGRTPRTRTLLQQLVSLQPIISEVYSAWERIPRQVFGSEQHRAYALATAVREGFFRNLVKYRATRAPLESFRSAGPERSVAWQKVESQDVILLEWISALRGGEDVVEPSAVAARHIHDYGGRRYRDHPTEKELKGFIQGESVVGRAASNARLVRHLLAGCRSCQERTRAELNPSEYNYDRAFVGANRALSDFLAAEKAPEQPVEVLLQELTQLPVDDQFEHIDSDRRFSNPALVRRLTENSHASRYNEPSRMLYLADLARRTAAACSVESAGSKSKLADLQTHAWGHYGNALRILGRLKEADEALEEAQRHMESGTRDPVLRARICTQRVSLLTYQGRYGEAIELADEAAQIYRELDETQSQASSMVQKAVAHLYAGDMEEAIDILNRAIPLIDPESTHLLLAACHNLITCYIGLNQPERALSLYFEIRDLYKEFNDDLILLRAGWQEGQLLRDLGHLRAAETALLQARKGFLERNLATEVALVSLDLAWVYVKLGKVDKLEQTVTETIPIFRALGVGRETLAALLQLQHAAEQEQKALELIRFLNKVTREDVGVRHVEPL